MKCYLNNPKYAFLPDAVYVYRKNDQSVSFRYREDSRECWLTIAYKLRYFLENICLQMKERNIKDWSIIYYFLRAFLRQKWNMYKIGIHYSSCCEVAKSISDRSTCQWNFCTAYITIFIQGSCLVDFGKLW